MRLTVFPHWSNFKDFHNFRLASVIIIHCIIDILLSDNISVLLLLGGIKRVAIFWCVLVCGVYIIWPNQFKPWKVPTVVGSIVVVGALTCCALLHSMCDLKVTQMNMQHSIICDLMLCDFKLGCYMTEATKNVFCVKGKGLIIHRKVQEILLRSQ